MSKISIIVPCYNVAEYLPRCLDALLAQTYSDWQAVCVDDGSTDNSFEILQSYAEKDARIIAIHQENHGVEWARATAMEHIDSPYIMFCDPDDWYEPEMCEKMIATLERENVDIVMCGTNIVGMEDYAMQKYFSNMPSEGRYENPAQFYDMGGLALWRFIFKKENFDKFGLFFPKDINVKRGYDTSFIVQYLMSAKSIYFMADKLHNYWQRADSLVHSFNTGKSKNKFDVWYGFEYLLKFLVQNNLYDTYKNDILDWINKRFYYLFVKLSDEGKIKALDIIYDIFSPYKKDITLKYNWLYLVVYKKYQVILKKLFNVREIKIGKICLYKRIRDGKNKEYYLFDILIFKKIKQKGNKQIYLGKWCIYRRGDNL